MVFVCLAFDELSETKYKGWAYNNLKCLLNEVGCACVIIYPNFIKQDAEVRELVR